MLKLLAHAISLSLVCLAAVAAAANNDSKTRLAVSIAPLALIAEEIYGERVEVLLKGATSPHHSNLRPSDLRAIANVDLIFWVGPGLERSLVKALVSRPNVALHHLLGEPKNEDPHIWLDIELAGQIAELMASKLVLRMPEKKLAIDLRVIAFKNTLRVLDDDLRQQLQGLAPFIAFHDSLGYLSQRYQLPQVASLTDVPEESIGLRTLSQMAANAIKAQCLVAESGEAKAAEGYARRLGLPLITLDILASEKSYASYHDFFSHIVASVTKCKR